MKDSRHIELIKDDKIIEKKSIDWPQNNYIELIENIKSIFKINSPFVLDIVDLNDDDIIINSKDDFLDFKDNIKKIKIILVKEGDNDDNNNLNNLKRIIESRLSNDYNNINLNDFNLDLDDKNNKELLNKEKNKILSEFNIDINKDFNEIIEQESEIIKSNIDNSLSEHLNLFSSKLNNINSKINEIYKSSEQLKQISLSNNNLSNQMADLNNQMADLNNQMPNINPLEPMSMAFPKNNEFIIFTKNKLELEIEKKKAGYIEINNIEIKNISHNSYKSLSFIIDKEKSSKEFIFYGNIEINRYELSVIRAKLSPGEHQEYNTILRIQYPKPGQIYKVYIYLTDKYIREGKPQNISNYLEINIKIKQDKENKEDQMNQIIEELNNEFDNLNTIININDLKKLTEENNFDKNAIKSVILEKIEEIKKKESEKEKILIKENAEQIYSELIQTVETDISKDIIIEKIIEEKLNLEELKKWIKEENEKIINKKVEDILIELSKEIDLSNNDKNEIITKIKELNFDKEKIKIFYNNNNDKNLELLNEIYEELENDWGISGHFDEDVVQKIIKELNYDRQKIREWVENNL